MFQSDEYRLSDLSLSRFGGGFELMKAGEDNHGLRALFQPFFRYASVRGMLAVADTLQGSRDHGACLLYFAASPRDYGKEGCSSTCPCIQQRKGPQAIANGR